MVAFDCEWTPGRDSKLTVIILAGSIPVAGSEQRQDVSVTVVVYNVSWEAVDEHSDQSLWQIKRLFACKEQRKLGVHIRNDQRVLKLAGLDLYGLEDLALTKRAKDLGLGRKNSLLELGSAALKAKQIGVELNKGGKDVSRSFTSDSLTTLQQIYCALDGFMTHVVAWYCIDGFSLNTEELVHKQQLLVAQQHTATDCGCVRCDIWHKVPSYPAIPFKRLTNCLWYRWTSYTSS